MSHSFNLRHVLSVAAVCAPLFFALSAHGDHPPLGGIEEPPVQATEPIFETVIDEGSFRLKRFPLRDTTLINDVETTGKPVTTASQTRGECKASQASNTACKAPATEQVAEQPAGGKWRPVTFPENVQSGPCGTESHFCVDAVFGVSPQSTVYGDVLRLFETPAIQQAAATCNNPHCPVTNLTAAVQGCPFCCESCACTACDKSGQSIARSLPVAAIVKAKSKDELQRGEAAEVILNLIDDVGPSVLKGTLFEDLAGGCLMEHGCKMAADQEAARELVIQWIRQLENDEQSKAIKQPATDGKPQAKYVKIKHVDKRAESAVALREVARTLDGAAELLEERSLYPRADQLREIAQQIRHEARGHFAPTAHRPQPPMFPHPPFPPAAAPAARDLESELEQIRRQLEHVRDALRWQQGEAIR